MNFNTRYQARYDRAEWYRSRSDAPYSPGLLDQPYLSLYESPLGTSLGPLEASVFTPLDGRDPLYSFFESKRRIIGGGIRDVTGLIQEREAIKERNLYSIEYDACKVLTRLYELDHWPPETNFSVERKRANFEKELLDFEREKRMEEVACWRDVTRLRGELRELVGKAHEEQRRRQLIQGD
ncbi:MAG: hypothetical protein GC154_20355 [bacterium]|nr:hypothetical protein [bacterium]